MNELQRVVAELRAAGFADWASRIEAAQAVAPGEVEVLDPKGLAETMNVIADRIATRADRYFGRTGESDVQRMGFRGYAIELRMLASTVAAAPASEAKGHEVIEMRLCEAPHLILKRDQLYRFTVDPNCPQCREAAMAYADIVDAVDDPHGECPTCHQPLHVEQEQAGELPPLPPPAFIGKGNDGKDHLFYTVEQMDNYARTALLGRAARVEVTKAADAELDTLRRQLAEAQKLLATRVESSRLDEAIDRAITAEAKLTLVEEEKRKAFVEGAKWWEWHTEKATMWPSDQQLACGQAKERYPDNTP